MTAEESFSSDTRRLVLMRHAKSDAADQQQSDHQRTLNERGRKDARRVAAWLAEIGAVPDLILCSSAVRTQETASLVAEQYPEPPTVLATDALYLAPPADVLRTVRSDGCDARVLLVIGHNPGLADLVASLDGEPVHLTPAAAAVFSVLDSGVESDWGQLRSGDQLRLEQLVTPEAL